MVNKSIKSIWYHERRWAAVVSVGALVGCYIMASLAIDSGSLLQYLAAVILLVLGVNRFAHIILITAKKKVA